MNRVAKKCQRYLEQGADVNQLAKQFPKSFHKVMRWKRYKDFKWQKPQPWRGE